MSMLINASHMVGIPEVGLTNSEPNTELRVDEHCVCGSRTADPSLYSRL